MKKVKVLDLREKKYGSLRLLRSVVRTNLPLGKLRESDCAGFAAVPQTAKSLDAVGGECVVPEKALPVWVELVVSSWLDVPGGVGRSIVT